MTKLTVAQQEILNHINAHKNVDHIQKRLNQDVKTVY